MSSPSVKPRLARNGSEGKQALYWKWSIRAGRGPRSAFPYPFESVKDRKKVQSLDGMLTISALDVLVVQYQSAFKVQCAFVQSPVSCKCYRILPSTGCGIGYCAGYCTRDRLSASGRQLDIAGFVMDTIIIRVRATKRLRSYPFGSLMTRLAARLVVVVDWYSLEVIDPEDVGEEMFACSDYRPLRFHRGLRYFGDRGGPEQITSVAARLSRERASNEWKAGLVISTCNHNRIPYFQLEYIENNNQTTIDLQEPLTHTGKTRRELEWKAYKAYTKKFYGNGSRPGDSVPKKPEIEKRKTLGLLVLHPTRKDKAFSFHSSKLHLFRKSPPSYPSIRAKSYSHISSSCSDISLPFCSGSCGPPPLISESEEREDACPIKVAGIGALVRDSNGSRVPEMKASSLDHEAGGYRLSSKLG
ncbi:hypothetical protein SADUNF_SadunfMtG0006900 (mitochondrion) [Salix dunnii]|uniref:Uncharacterized protein n=1 Tax=Salix dunnii TaxID=1413687 RepID=A0A835MBY6_9ROSI|nr:hypothetical protein SADUNF_SadunfMtG0006900 [Salix dunnii]